MDKQERNVQAAIDDSVRRHWEWFRDVYDLFMLEDGKPDEDPVMPPWDSLSPNSQAVVTVAVGTAIMAMADTAFALPEIQEQAE